MQLRTTTCLFVLGLASAAWLPAAAIGQNGPPQGPAAPQAPTASQAPAAPGSSATASPVPAANPHPFPPVDPANFKATSPTKQTVEDFLKASWGYDTSRIWQVQAILPTPAAGVSRVLVLVTSKNPGPKDQTAQLSFFTLPDGKFLVADSLLPFGAKPFQPYREILQAKASGPSQGGPSKALELVEFSDFECPHCKEAQPIIAKLLADYPSAHFVYQDFPLVQIHTEALKAATHGYCVAKAGNDAFFKFSDALFATQAGLTPATSDATLKDAETKAGQDPAKIAACADTAAAKDAIKASLALGEQVGVNSTPTLFVNGRGLPIVGIPYAMLQKIIEYQAQLDGVPVPPAPPAPPEKPAPSLR
jgi:protein-disulfide isomerase